MQREVRTAGSSPSRGDEPVLLSCADHLEWMSFKGKREADDGIGVGGGEGPSVDILEAVEAMEQVSTV